LIIKDVYNKTIDKIKIKWITSSKNKNLPEIKLGKYKEDKYIEIIDMTKNKYIDRK
jgi:hypothetical protein